MTKRRHVLIMSSWYPTRIDPHSGNYVTRFAELLAETYQVTVLHTRSEERIGIQIDDRSQNFRTLIVYHPRSGNPISKYLNQRKALTTGLKMATDVDLVFGHILSNKGWQFLFAKNHFSCPLMVLEHGTYFRKERPFGFLEKRMIKSVLQKAESILAVSDVLRKDMLRIFPNLEIDLLSNPVDPSWFSPDVVPERQEFIHISTLDEVTKRPQLLFDALVVLKHQNRFPRMLIITDQPTERWRNLVESLGLSETITFKGPLTAPEIAEEMKASGALVHPALYETFGIVLAEAWLCGKPVISTPVGIAAKLEPYQGILIDGNAESLAGGMSEFLDNRQRYDGRKISASAHQYTTSEVRKELLGKIEKLCDRGVK